MRLLGKLIAALSIGVCLAATVACDRAPHVDNPVEFPWQEVTLPAVGVGEHVSVRAATGCADHWYLTGAIVGADGTTRPAAWVSRDAVSWKSLTLTPNTYYGRLNTLYAAACRFGFLAALGAKVGGAHGFPRTSNWFERSDGVVGQIEPPYTVYGGPEGVNVARLAAGPASWMETGNRVSGAAVWLSDDAETYRLVEGAPGLANDSSGTHWADDVVSTTNGWTVVGSVTRTGHIDGDPGVWVSADGASWRAVEVPATTLYEEIQRVTTVDETVVGIGLRGTGFGAWRGDESSWSPVGEFGTSGGPGKGMAAALTRASNRLIALTTDGSSYALWQSTNLGTAWQRVSLPAPAKTAAAQATTVFARGNTVVLAIDDGAATHLWVANLAGQK